MGAKSSELKVSDDSARTSEPAPRAERLLLVVPRVGVLLLGRGHATTDGSCNSAARSLLDPAACETSEPATSESATALLETDVLFRLGHFRPGFGVAYQFDLATGVDTADRSVRTHFGGLLYSQGMLDAAYPVSMGLDLVARASIGPTFLLEGDDLANSRRGIVQACAQTAGARCSISGRPLVGLAAGMSGGVVFQTDVGRLRSDLSYQYLYQPLFAVDLSQVLAGSEVSSSIDTSLQTHRLWLLLGLEL